MSILDKVLEFFGIKPAAESKSVVVEEVVPGPDPYTAKIAQQAELEAAAIEGTAEAPKAKKPRATKAEAAPKKAAKKTAKPKLTVAK